MDMRLLQRPTRGQPQPCQLIASDLLRALHTTELRLASRDLFQSSFDITEGSGRGMLISYVETRALKQLEAQIQ